MLGVVLTCNATESGDIEKVVEEEKRAVQYTVLNRLSKEPDLA